MEADAVMEMVTEMAMEMAMVTAMVMEMATETVTGVGQTEKDPVVTVYPVQARFRRMVKWFRDQMSILQMVVAQMGKDQVVRLSHCHFLSFSSGKALNILVERIAVQMKLVVIK